MSLLTCRNAAFSYEGVEILSNVTFAVNAGDYLGIVGENGAGKSTLLKGILQMKALAGGEILLGDGLQRNEIGYLPQQTILQKDFPASVMEVVLSGCLNHMKSRWFYTQNDRTFAEEKMKLLGIETLKDRCYRELSGGQRQRVLLARALCAAQKLLLMDEPVSGLDPGAAADFYEQIRKLNQKENMAVIMVSHDIEKTIQEATHILYIQNKETCFDTAENFRRLDLKKIFKRGVQKDELD